MKKTLRIVSLLMASVTGLLVWQSQRPTPPTARPEPSGVAAVDAPATASTTPAEPTRTGRHVTHAKIEGAPTWTIRYGEEFWHRRPQAPSPVAGQNASAGLNLAQIVDRVSHALRPEGTTLTAQDQSFTARFGDDGFSLSLKRLAETSAHKAGADNPPTIELDPAEITFKTRRVQNGSLNLYSTGNETGDWSVTGNTAQRQLNENRGLIEHYTVQNQGVEVTWVLNQAPLVAASLIIESELNGLTYQGRDDRGLMFGEADSTIAKIRAGDVTVVDAAGTRTALPLVANGNVLHVEVPATLLASAQYPIAIDPLIGPAFPLIYSPNTNGQFWPAVAGNGTNYLVVWTDMRGTPANGNHIWGTRASPAGLVLDPSGLGICATTNSANTPRVASCQGDWLVVWHDGRNYGTTGSDIYGGRVSSGGSLLDGDGFAICANNYDQNFPDVGASSTGYLVSWTDDRIYHSGSADIFGGRVTTGGAVLDGTGFNISGTSGGLTHVPRVASDGTNFMVVWYDWDWFTPSLGAWGRKVLSTGTPSGSTFIIRSNSGPPSIAWSAPASTYLTVFTYDGQTIPFNSAGPVYGNRLSSSGTLTDGGTGFLINTNVPGLPAVSCNGPDFLVAWVYAPYWNSGTTFGARVKASDASVKDPTGFNISQRSYLPFSTAAVGNVGTNFCVVWDQDASPDDDTGDIWGAFVSGSGAVTALTLMSTDGSSISGKGYMDVAALGTTYLVSWQDTRNDYGDIYATLVTESGLVQTPSGIAICATGDTQQEPHVTASTAGNQFFVVWDDYRSGSSGIYGARISSGGTVLDANGFLIQSSPVQGPAVEASGTNYLVTWVRLGLQAKRVATDAYILDSSPFQIAPSASSMTYADIASIGTNWLVTWHQVSPNYNVYANRVTSTGTVLDGNGFGVSTNSSIQFSPQVAANGTNYLIVWGDTRNGVMDVYAARISPSGTVLDSEGIPVCLEVGGQYYLGVASDGADFYAVWQDNRGGAGMYDHTLYGGLILANGVVPNTLGSQLDSTSTPNARSNRPGLASGSRHRYLVAYQAGSDARARFITPQKLEAVTLSSSVFSMRLVGGKQGTSVQVDSSSDLITWTSFANVTMGSDETVSFTDTGVSGVGARFYRASSTPGYADTAIGFYRVTVPGQTTNAFSGGYEMMGIHLLNPTNNTAATLFAGVPSGTEIMIWTNNAFVTNAFNGTSWTDGGAVYNPGAGMFVHNPGTNTMTVSQFGMVRQGILINGPFPGGGVQTMCSSILPMAGAIDSVLQYVPGSDDMVYEWKASTQEYDQINMYYQDEEWALWYPETPTLTIGQGIFLAPWVTNTWKQTFTVW